MPGDIEKCTAGGWKTKIDPDRFDEVAERIRRSAEPDADTQHMLVWHHDGVKCSLVRSSGTMIVRTEERSEAADIIADVASA